jgi:hypothetical protein
MSSKPVSNSAFITTGAVPQVGSAAAGGWVGAVVGATVAGAAVAGAAVAGAAVAGAAVAGAAVAGATVAGAAVAGAAVAGAAVVAGAPQAESSMDAKTSRLTNEYKANFLFISQSPL